jgi:hypothetical protein
MWLSGVGGTQAFQRGCHWKGNGWIVQGWCERGEKGRAIMVAITYFFTNTKGEVIVLAQGY